MPQNVEIKTRLTNRADVRRILESLGARPAGVLEQVDRYYELDEGRRMKLRTFGGGRAEMIRYDRPEREGVRSSRYEVTPVRDDEARTCLVPKGLPLVTVRKERELYQLENVRIHLDRVDGLGEFLELEAVVDDQHEEQVCRAQVDRLLGALGIRAEDLIRASYADLLRARNETFQAD